jgi:uncharacterized protein with NAD-binding domain and iron-sulfur cluster
MSQKIIILGGGVGGLTVAHELVHSGEYNHYDIHIYERNDCIGGMARSGFKSRNGNKVPTEYCWRIYGPCYNNLREILKQIPLSNNSSKTVHDNLVDVKDFLIADQGTVFHMNNRPTTLFKMRRAFKNVPFRQKWYVLRKILYCFMISTHRLNDMDNMTWKEYIDPTNKLCHDMKKYIIDIMGPYLGAEPLLVNVPSVAKTLESFKVFNRPISVMRGPTSEAWFLHWQKHLEAKGVTFHFNDTVTDIRTEGDRVQSAALLDGTEITGDVFFCSLPIESIANMPSLKIEGMKELAKLGHQLMVGVQLYFDKKIPLPTQNTALYIPNSPWQLVIEPQGSIWNQRYDDIADIWSIGLCDPVREGLLIKKPFVECSHEEIKKEVWFQITKSEFGKYLNLDSVQIVDHQVWDTYVYDGKRLSTREPKFSTNKGTYYLRPNNKTKFGNLHFATAYTKTETDMFEMESAAEAGRQAARTLEKSVRVLPTPRPLFFFFYRWFDKKLHKFDCYSRLPFVWLLLGFPFLILLPFAYVYSKFGGYK